MPILTINGERKEYPKGTLYAQIAKEYQPQTKYDILLVEAGGKLLELSRPVEKDCTLNFITAKDTPGIKAYERSLV